MVVLLSLILIILLLFFLLNLKMFYLLKDYGDFERLVISNRWG